MNLEQIKVLEEEVTELKAKVEKLRSAIIQHSKFCDLHFNNALIWTNERWLAKGELSGEAKKQNE